MAEWVPASGTNIPEHAVRGGCEADGSPLFVARANHEGAWTPGKAGFHIPGCHYPYGGEELIAEDYEVLVLEPKAPGILEWKHCEGGCIPNAENAFCTSPNEAYYVARTEHEGALTPGKLHTAHNCCYVSYGGKEHMYPTFEVLYKRS